MNQIYSITKLFLLLEGEYLLVFLLEGLPKALL